MKPLDFERNLKREAMRDRNAPALEWWTCRGEDFILHVYQTEKGWAFQIWTIAGRRSTKIYNSKQQAIEECQKVLIKRFRRALQKMEAE